MKVDYRDVFRAAMIFQGLLIVYNGVMIVYGFSNHFSMAVSVACICWSSKQKYDHEERMRKYGLAIAEMKRRTDPNG